jgi:serine/threonine protein kinase
MDEHGIPEGFIALEGLGSGSFGRVELVQRESDDTIYALKILNSQAGIESAEVEIGTLSLINSPFVTKVYNVFRSDNGISFLIDAALGGSLRQKIAVHKEQKIPMDHDEVLNIFTQILLGLSAIHKQGIVHRDVGPGNILFVEQNPPGFSRVLIIDLGVAGIMSQGTLQGTCGTPQYMAPEVAKGLVHDTRADLYSLGVVLYEMIELKLPAGPGNVELENYPEMSKLVSRFLSANPADRPDCEKCLRVKNIAAVAQEFENVGRVILTIDDFKPIDYQFDDTDLGFDELPVFDTSAGAAAGLARLMTPGRRHRQDISPDGVYEAERAQIARRERNNEILQKERDEAERTKMALREMERSALVKARYEKNALASHSVDFRQRLEKVKLQKRERPAFTRSGPQPVQIVLSEEEKGADELERMRIVLEKKWGTQALIQTYRKLEKDAMLSPGELQICPQMFDAVSRLLRRDKEIYLS